MKFALWQSAGMSPLAVASFSYIWHFCLLFQPSLYITLYFRIVCDFEVVVQVEVMAQAAGVNSGGPNNPAPVQVPPQAQNNPPQKSDGEPNSAQQPPGGEYKAVLTTGCLCITDIEHERVTLKLH